MINLKIKSKIPRTEKYHGQICSECLHAISNHTLTIDTKDKKYSKLKCLKCKSRKCAW